jgi:hypothetical protein
LQFASHIASGHHSGEGGTSPIVDLSKAAAGSKMKLAGRFPTFAKQ